MAMIDMADNSNKMGTSMEAIQTAYAGFAKQNYTMLDNLKLGYGGTKKEMERLLEDAEKLTGKKYDIDNLSDVYKAIHAVQEELNITGTTAKEASSTLQGSFSAMKASFTNLLGAMSLGDDITPQLEALAQTTSTWLFGNFIPMVTQILANVPQLIVGMLETGVPIFLEEGGKLLNSLQEGIILNLPTLAETALQTISGFTNGLAGNLGSLIATGTTLLQNLITGIVNTIPVLLAQIPQIVSGIVTAITTNFPLLVQNGMNLITNLAKGIWDNREAVWSYIREMIAQVTRLITEIDWVGLGSSVITWLANGVQALFSLLPTLLSEIATNGWDIIKNIDWMGLGSTVINAITSGIKTLFSAIPDVLKSIGDSAKSMVTKIDWLGLGRDIINGIISGIKNAGSMLWNSLKDVASSALNAAKRFLKIGSPSKVFADEVGQWIPEGVAVGVEANADALTDAMENLAYDSAQIPVERFTAPPRAMDTYTTSTTNMGGVTININATDYNSDPFAIAEAINNILTDDMNREEAVYG